MALVGAGTSIVFSLAAGTSAAVTCVNNLPANNPDSIYVIDVTRGVVTDTRTALMWKRTEESTAMSWWDALAAAEAATHAGYIDWRLPNIKELRSLVEECRVSPSINDTAFPGASSSYVWSGSPTANPSYAAWYVSFDFGNTSGYGLRGTAHPVRLVRGGQSFGALVPPTLSNVSATTTTLTATSNAVATGYWIAVARGATAPTAAQVKARVTYAGVTIVASGSGATGAMGAGVVSSFPIAGLSASMLYDFYLVAEDAAGNVSLVAKAQNSVSAECAASTVATVEYVDLSSSMTVAAAANLLGIRNTFNVTCTNGRFGVVRIPKVLASAALGGQAYALVQSYCATKPVQKMADPAATTAAVYAAMNVKTNQVALLADPVVGPLARWVCE